MMAVLTLDVSSIINVHVLTEANRERAQRRRRGQHQRGEAPNKRKPRNDDPDQRDRDDHCLMQMPAARAGPRQDRVQNGDIRDNEVADIVRVAMNTMNSEEPHRQDWVKQQLHAMAASNMGSRVPAARKVAAVIVKKLAPDMKEKHGVTKSIAKSIWKRARSSSLKWARKRYHPHAGQG